MKTLSAPTFDVPETPWHRIAKQRAILRRLWNRDNFDLDQPVIRIDWKWELPPELRGVKGKHRVLDAELDVRYQLAHVRHQIDCLNASDEVGLPLCNMPAFDLIHFGTGPLSTAFGSKFVLRDHDQPYFEPGIHTPEEALALEKPDLYVEGICPQILDRIQFYNEATSGKVILTPCDTAGPWSIATSVWHYEDMLAAIRTHPDAVHHVAGLVTDAMIEWYNIQETYIGRWGRTHTSFSFPWFQRGVHMGDDCMVTVSPQTWEEFFLPYNNRLAREYGDGVTYHCCMCYDTYFPSLAKTQGFIGFDATPEYNDFDRIAETLSAHRGVWTWAGVGPNHMDKIRRLKGKVGMLFYVAGDTREAAIDKTKRFIDTIQAL